MILVLVAAEKNTNIVMADKINTKSLASFIDNTLLRPDVTRNEIIEFCRLSAEKEFAGVCIPPYFVAQAAKELAENETTKVITVIGFPMGYNMTNTKAQEAKKALDDEADELDMVMNIAAFKSGNYSLVKDDIESITTLCRMKDRKIKLIIETGLLTADEIKRACELAAESNVDYLKTSTGFLATKKQLTPQLIQKLRSLLPDKILIKASGGIKDTKFALELIEAGASRLGTSSGLKIIGNEG